MKIFKTKEEIDYWFTTSEPGSVACYGIATKLRRPLNFMLRHASEYHERNQVQLFQKKQPNGSFHYLIRKPRK